MPRIMSPRSFSLIFAAAATSAALGPGGAAASGGAGAASPMLASACCTVAVQGAPGGACASISRQIAAALALSPSCSAATPMKKRALGSLLSSATARSKAVLASTVTMPLADAVSASPRSACRSAVSPESAITLRLRVDGIGKAPEPQIDRRQHGVAARVVRIFFEMRLDLRDQLGDRRVFVHGREPLGQRLRPAVAASRSQDKARPRRAAATPARRRRSRGGGAAANRRFRLLRLARYRRRRSAGARPRSWRLRLRLPRSVRSRGRARSRRVDRGRPRHRCRRRPRDASRQRPEHGKYRRRRHQREHEPQGHEVSLPPPAPGTRRAYIRGNHGGNEQTRQDHACAAELVQLNAVQLPSGLRQAVPRTVSGRPSI